MKTISSILLLLIFCSGFVAKVGLLCNYEIRKSYITQHFCVNKNKPEMHCNGKCYLAKQLKAVEGKETDKENNSNKKVTPEEWLLFFSNGSYKPNAAFFVAHLFPALLCFTADCFIQIFHPPS